MAKVRVAHAAEHHQEVPAVEWVVVHNRGFKPIVNCMLFLDGVWEVVLPVSIKYIDLNTFVVKWAQARTGKLRYS